MRKLLLLSLSFVVLGCGHDAQPSGQAPAAGAVGTTYPADTRVSPHGVVRPTLAATTEEEEVEYHNPNIGTDTTNDLEVDRDANGNVERINFPNGGWKEVKGEMVDNGDGKETYTDEHGYEYIVKKKKDGLSDSGISDDERPNPDE